MGKAFLLAEGRMKNTQGRILDWLKDLEPELGELYEGAFRLISQRGFPGRGRLICHAVREIRNRLPDAVAGKGKAERLEYAEEVSLIAKMWARAGLEGVYEKQSGNTGCEPEEQVPREVLVSVDRLVRRHKEVGGRKERNARRLLMALEPENKRWQGSLAPIVKRWLEETEWFVGRCHIRRSIDEGDLIEHFEIFENVLGSLVGFFYEGFDRIKEIVSHANTSASKPRDGEVRKAISLLGRARFRIQFFSELENPHWIKPLKDAGFFRIPTDAEEGEAYERWPEGWYLKKVSSEVPGEVLGIISGVTCRNPYIRGTCVECLLEMPVEVGAKGGEIVKNILPRGTRAGSLEWAWIGERCAKLMVRLIEKHPKEAFGIARLLLDVWVPKEKKLFEDSAARFSEREYKRLVFDFYSKVWEKRAFEATRLLVGIYDGYLEKYNKEKGYDTSEYVGVGIEDLENIERLEYNLEAIVVKGVCDAGRRAVEKEPGRVKRLMDELEMRNKAIFYRVAMYLLRFVKKGAETKRIEKVIANKKFIENPWYQYEHRRLLNEKFDEVSDEVKKVFIEWVKQQKVSDDRRDEIKRECEERNEKLPDFEKMENRAKGEELYLVRTRAGLRDLYEEYKKKAAVEKDGDLSPRRMVGEARWVSPTEGTPLEAEVMRKMGCDEVLDYILERSNYEGEEKPRDWRSPVGALRATFQGDVKKRPLEYLKCNLGKLGGLPAEFLSGFFYGVQDTVRDGSFEKSGWANLIKLGHTLVRAKHEDENYRNCFSAMLLTLRDGFSERQNKIEFDEGRVRAFWEIIEPLVHFPVGERSRFGEEEEEDPVQMQGTLVAGEALYLTVPLGIVCKRDFPKLDGDFLREAKRKCYERVLSEVKQPGVNCVFGLDFARIYWTDGEWVEQNLDGIFGEELWDETWGTYVSWGRPSEKGFRLLVEREQYGKAVERLERKSRFKFGKEPNEGLVEHLMIGFFNGWVGLEDKVLKEFFGKASAELRGEAAKFLTTGFKSANEEGGKRKEEVSARMRAYWENRLAAIGENREESEDEAVELTGWVEDSVLGAEETLELLERSLDLSGGKIGKMRDAREFIEGVTELGKGNELLGLRCLKKAAGDENMHTPWADIQKPLVSFLEGVAELVELREDVRSEGEEVADLYGRYNPDEFRGVWEKLREKK